MIRLASIALLQVFILGTAHAQLVKADPDAEAPLESTVIDARMLVYPADGPTTLGPTHGRGSSAQFVFTGDEPEADAPSDVVFTADGSTIIIAHRESRNLILWDAATRTFLGEVPISGAAQGLDVTPDGTTAVVANLDNDTVSIVDLGSLAETSIVPAGLNPGVVKISPAGDVAAVSITGSSELAVLDIATATIVRTIPNIGYWMRVSFSPEPTASSIQFSEIHFIDNDRVINIDRFNNELQIANVRTGSVTRIPVAPNGMDVSVSLDGTTAAITHTSSTRLITLVDLASETVSGTVSTPEDLWGEIALNTDGSKAVVAVLNASRVVDLTTGTVGPSLFTASVNQMITTHDGQYVLCVGYYGALIGFASGSVEVFTNARVSTEFGAVSAVDHRAAMCSTTFGDDLVVANTNGSSGGLEAFQLTGPLP
ncbi:MAG: YncE family protein, partial [Planctomycetota bacterium]